MIVDSSIRTKQDSEVAGKRFTVIYSPIARILSVKVGACVVVEIIESQVLNGTFSSVVSSSFRECLLVSNILMFKNCSSSSKRQKGELKESSESSLSNRETQLSSELCSVVYSSSTGCTYNLMFFRFRFVANLVSDEKSESQHSRIRSRSSFR